MLFSNTILSLQINPEDIVRVILCIPFCLASNVTDYKELRIPNKLTLLGLCTGLLVSIISGVMKGSFYSVLYAMSAWVVGILPAFILMPFYILKMIGAGDIKFFSAIGSMVGWKCSFIVIIISFIASGMLGVIVLIHRRIFTARMCVVVRYIKLCFFTRSIMTYDSAESGNEPSGRFAFSYGITIAVMVVLVIYVINYNFRI